MPKKAPFQQRAHKLRIYFREWRAHRGLTQQQLADRIGTTKGRVSLKERGEEGWDEEYLADLAYALSTEPASLLMRNPLDSDAPWSLLDSLGPQSREKVLDYARMLKRDEEEVPAAATEKPSGRKVA